MTAAEEQRLHEAIAQVKEAASRAPEPPKWPLPAEYANAVYAATAENFAAARRDAAEVVRQTASTRRTIAFLLIVLIVAVIAV